MSYWNPFKQTYCPECFGSGLDPEDFGWDSKCPLCQGSGLVYIESPTSRLDRPRDLDQLLNPSDERVAELRAMPYVEYLWSPEWRQRRAMHIRQADFTCDRCSTRTRKYGELHVHHKSYERFGREDSADLEVLCAACHQKEHGIS